MNINSESVKLFADNYSSMVKVNSMFCESLQFYNERITYNRHRASSRKLFLDVEKIIENYVWVHTNKQCLEELDKVKLNNCGKCIIDKMEFLLQSEIKSNIDYERRNTWKKHIVKIEEIFNNIKRIYEHSDFSSKDAEIRESRIVQWLIEIEQFYNLVFQMIMRHKSEVEYKYELRAPLVFEDTILENGKRELVVYVYCAEVTNGQSLDLFINDEKVKSEKVANDERSGKFNFIYDPENFEDTLTIKTVSKTYINGEIVVSSVKYGIPKMN